VLKLTEFLVGAGAKLYHTSMQELTALLITWKYEDPRISRLHFVPRARSTLTHCWC
jgi:hypothetical protein